jgi:hypothetical protein
MGAGVTHTRIRPLQKRLFKGRTTHTTGCDELTRPEQIAVLPLSGVSHLSALIRTLLLLTSIFLFKYGI